MVGPVLASDVYLNTPPWVHFKLHSNAFESKVIVSIDPKGSRDGISAGLHAWRSGCCLAQWVRMIW